MLMYIHMYIKQIFLYREYIKKYTNIITLLYKNLFVTQNQKRG